MKSCGPNLEKEYDTERDIRTNKTTKERTFVISEKQMAQFTEWRKKNGTPLVVYQLGTVLENFSFTFTANGIGDCIQVKDLVTGQELELTDIDSW